MSASCFQIAALAGDGIGPELTRETVHVLRAVEQRLSLTMTIT
jgi:isocitrate/isopropylmalate dehydrogenase